MDKTPPPNNYNRQSGKVREQFPTDGKGNHRQLGGVEPTSPEKKMRTIPEESETDSDYGSGSDSLKPEDQFMIKGPAAIWKRIINYIEKRETPVHYPEPLIHEALTHMVKGQVQAMKECLNNVPLPERFNAIKMVRFTEPENNVAASVLEILDQQMINAFVDQFIAAYAEQLPDIYVHFRSDPANMHGFMAKLGLTPDNPGHNIYINITSKLMITMEELIEGH